MIQLPCGEKNYDTVVFIEYRNVTDGQTDRIAIANIACQCANAR